ncbi:hypothetical protein J6590_060720 [Homalodisca vitripennis]|nr:hypothetical protein J6590_060720 [Homalodisca vitripennis]
MIQTGVLDINRIGYSCPTNSPCTSTYVVTGLEPKETLCGTEYPAVVSSLYVTCVHERVDSLYNHSLVDRKAEISRQ